MGFHACMALTQSIPEQKIVDQVTARVRDRMPDVATQTIETAVLLMLAEYADSTVRDFLPILIEREVVAQLLR